MPRKTTGSQKRETGVERSNSIAKAPSGIDGLDEILQGGLPAGRATLICGGPGCGKSMMALQFLAAGARNGEPGVLVSFEETAEEMIENGRTLSIDLASLIEQNKLLIEFVHVERAEIEETGEYDLEGLFIRLAGAIQQVGAKRIAVDCLEALLAGFSNEIILRAELRRLFRWFKSEGLTSVITAEQGKDSLTRIGTEEYVSDCVLVLSNPTYQNVSTRSLRVLKYRGSAHGHNEYPFLIDDRGISIMPITSFELASGAPRERVSSGIASLDEMLGGEGLFRGSSVLLSGSAGTGKTSFAAHFVNAACKRGERCLFLSYEESEDQLKRNMGSLGMALEKYVKKGLLRFHTARSTMYGLESHLIYTDRLVREFQPSIVVVDPINELTNVGVAYAVKSMLERLATLLKSRGITALFTQLCSRDDEPAGISSTMDAWIQLRQVETNGESNRSLFVVKSRGMSHSNRVREFVFSSDGIKLVDVVSGPQGVLTGSARTAYLDSEEAAARRRLAEEQESLDILRRKRLLLESKIAAMWAELEAEEDSAKQKISNSAAHSRNSQRKKS